jgi:hypothetical protein
MHRDSSGGETSITTNIWREILRPKRGREIFLRQKRAPSRKRGFDSLRPLQQGIAQPVGCNTGNGNCASGNKNGNILANFPQSFAKVGFCVSRSLRALPLSHSEDDGLTPQPAPSQPRVSSAAQLAGFLQAPPPGSSHGFSRSASINSSHFVSFFSLVIFPSLSGYGPRTNFLIPSGATLRKGVGSASLPFIFSAFAVSTALHK